jgi:ABC-type multidrug transport system fused ATPase/permease subunit
MIINQSILSLLFRLWSHINLRRRRQFGLLLVLMLLASFAEVFSIGAVLPFLSVLTSPQRFFDHAAARPIIQALGLSSPEQLLLPLTIIFGAAALIAGTMRLLLLWASTRLSFATGADLSINIYRRTLYQPYAVHCARNSSEVINGIAGKTSSAISIISQVLNIISSFVMLIVILIALLSIDAVIAVSAFVGFGLIYAFIIRMTRKKLLINSQRIAHESNSVIKALQEGLGGIRDVLIDGSQDIYCQIYRNADLPMRRAQGDNIFIGASPRYGMEVLGMLLIATLAYFLGMQADGVSKAIPVLGALALGALRLLPVLQQAYGAWAIIQGNQASLQDAIVLLNQPLPDHANQSPLLPLPFKKHIRLKQLEFRYNQQNPYVLKGVNLSIAKGSRVGFIGTTGSGKSTLLDVVMGLLQPSYGALEVDGEVISPSNCRAWQAHIAHVPQAIFLADSSVEENIAFGVPKDQIDINRVIKAAQQAQIAASIESWPEKYKTFVGERGVRLSGGQRQRIGIARALYKQADVIIFDEATSALDNETELAVMQAIDGLGKDLTLLIIAHRLTTLKNCTQIVTLSHGEIIRAGAYVDIVSQS